MTKTLETESKVFGYQLLLDLYDCKPGVCDDLTQCYEFLDHMVEALGMEKQSPPNIFRSDHKRFPDKAGLSGWAPLIESSIVIHTLSVKNFISVDVYCCKYFKIETARKICDDYFSPKKMDEQYIERGQDYFRSDSNYHSLTVKKDKRRPESIVLNKKEPVLA